MKEQKLKAYKAFYQKLQNANRIALMSHINPDIDTLWSATAMFQVLKEHFPMTQVDLICASTIPEKYLFLPYAKNYKKDFFPKEYDLIVFFDSWSKNQTGYDTMYPNLYVRGNYNTVSIDHHITNEQYATQNILNVTFASTTMILTEIFYVLGIFISQNTATSLLAWIYTDTWWLKHSNSSSLAYKMSAYLIWLWAQKDRIVRNFFESNSLKQMKLWGKILKESFIDSDWILHWYVNQTLLESYDCSYDDIWWVIDILNTTEGIKYTTLLTQKWDFIKGSLRTLRDDIDLTKIAKQFQWGWHKKASWFTTQWTIETFQFLQLKT